MAAALKPGAAEQRLWELPNTARQHALASKAGPAIAAGSGRSSPWQPPTPLL